MKDFSEQLSQAADCHDAAQQSKMYEQLAKQGCTEAQYHLAVNYYNGHGVQKDEQMSIGWLRHAAAAGDEDAASFLGGLLLHSENAEEVAEGEQLCLAAIARGDVPAHMNLGNYYYAQDRDAEAVPLFRYAADAGFVPAVYKLGLCHYHGLGVKQQLMTAFLLFREAAQEGHPAAAYYAALCHYRGYGTFENSEEGDRLMAQAAEAEYAPALLYRGETLTEAEDTREEGVRCLTRAAELGEDRAMFRLYCHFMDRKDKATAEVWLRRAAEAGNKEAQCDLGYLLMKEERSEEEQAVGVQWMQKAAEQGDATASYNLGLYFEHHPDLPDAAERAFRAMEQAAVQDYLPAIYRLSLYYFDGTGVRRDRKKAIASLRYAADGGYTSAAYSYGSILLDGDGVPQDIPTALRYLRQALSQGSGAAAFRLGTCYASGRGVCENDAQFLTLMRKAVRNGAADRVFEFAHTLREQENFATAYELYSLIAERGYTGGIWFQAQSLHLGLGCEQDDKAALALFRKGAKKGDPDCMESAARLLEKAGEHSQAFLMWKKAAAAGSESAEFNLAYCYDVGRGVPQNRIKANALYHAILEKRESIAAAANLGYNYLYGEGTDKDYDTAFRLLSTAAKGDNAYALFYLGRCYLNGWGTERDEAMAAEQWRRGAELGDAGCMESYARSLEKIGELKQAFRMWQKASAAGSEEGEFKVAYCYDVGLGVRENQVKANALYHALLEKSPHDAAANNLGYNYLYGLGTKENNDMAFRYLSIAVQEGSQNALLHLGRCYRYGWGTAPDINEAIRLLKQAAKHGIAAAMWNLGFIYYEGERGTPRDVRAAARWWRMGAELGNTDSMFEYGISLRDGEGVRRNYRKAVEWWRWGAEHNHVKCIGSLGCCAFHGKGVKRDYAAAVGYFRRALELDDDCVAAYNLAKRLYHGQGVEQNYEEALRYFRLSAKQQYADAIGMLGLMYEKGHAVEKNIRKALALYRRAVKRGSEDACYELGRCYEHGIGVSRNTKRALELYRQAAAKKCAAAKRALKRIERKN